jgi:putative RNA 2'-phosphotransferase
MITGKQLVRLSKLMSLILRHQPQHFQVTLDAEGYASIQEVLAAVRTRMPHATAVDLGTVVTTVEADKLRFTIVGGEIRANYGHSLAERIIHQPAAPPAVLLHGTSQSAVPAILDTGLRPMRRQYVHLTTDQDLATRIGRRHGPACILAVDAASAAAAGVTFYRANLAFWLADVIPACYVSVNG